jgi:hypothetical protein
LCSTLLRNDWPISHDNETPWSLKVTATMF